MNLRRAVEPHVVRYRRTGAGRERRSRCWRGAIRSQDASAAASGDRSTSTTLQSRQLQRDPSLASHWVTSYGARHTAGSCYAPRAVQRAPSRPAPPRIVQRAPSRPSPPERPARSERPARPDVQRAPGRPARPEPSSAPPSIARVGRATVEFSCHADATTHGIQRTPAGTCRA